MTDAAEAPEVLWQPDAQRIANAPMTRYLEWLGRHRGLRFADYEALWQWSTTDLEGFWGSIWEYFEIRSSAPHQRVLAQRTMPGAKWFPGARLNYAENLLRRAEEPDAAVRAALVFRSETRAPQTITWHQLRASVAGLMRSLRELGVAQGDRVASYMPNIPETAMAMLATTGIGAIWSSCSPDMGSVGVLDRFRQIEPVVLFAVDGYRYGGRDFERGEQLAELVAGLPSVKAVVLVDYLGCGVGSLSRVQVLGFEQARAVAGHEPRFEQLPFDAPLWVVYSSGTTGMPKPIVHGHGGALIEALKANALHLDVGRDDRFFWFSSTSWIMWNLWVSTLANGCTALHFDGNPGHPDLTPLWQFAAEERATFFGTSPAFIGLNMKAGIVPRERFDLSGLRTVGATGSPLTADAYRWVYRNVHPNVLLASISGGTDPGAAFLNAAATLPVRAGEMQCRGLGCAVQSFADDGTPQFGTVGELVVTEPLPSMPLFFWGDTDGRRYFESYFDTWHGVWRHGDWLSLLPRAEAVGAVIYGRSDSTINRHGIRMGTSELYRVVEGFDEVLDALVVDLEYLGRPSNLTLFVVLRDGASAVAPELADRLRSAIRTQLSARHVPDDVVAIPEVPRTMSGKKLEVPIKRVLLGHPPAKALNQDSMANPASVQWFIDFAARRGTASEES